MKNSKIVFITVASGFALMFNSCDKAKELAKIEVDFDMNVANLKLYIDTTSKTGSFDLATGSFPSELQQKLNDNNAAVEDIQSISLTSTEITMKNPGTQNFNIIDKITGSMSATGLAESQVATLNPVPKNVTTITLTSDGADIKEYLKQSGVNFKLKGSTNGPNVVGDSLVAKLIFNVKVKVKPS